MRSNSLDEWLRTADLKPAVRMPLAEFESLLALVGTCAMVLDRTPEPVAPEREYEDATFLASWVSEVIGDEGDDQGGRGRLLP